jgi:hypothetical protein
VIGVAVPEVPADFDFAFANMLEILEDWRRTVGGLVDPVFLDGSDVGLLVVVLDSELLASFRFSPFAGAALGAALDEVIVDVVDVA